MKKTVLLTLCALPLAFAQTQASEFTTEPEATAYWQIPLAVSQTGKEQQAFGFRLDQVVRDNTGNLVSSFSAPQRAAAVDFRFNDKGLHGVYVQGVNLASPAAMQAAEDSTTVWWIVGGTVAGMVGLAVWADNKGGSSSSSCTPVTFTDFRLNTAAPSCGPAFLSE